MMNKWKILGCNNILQEGGTIVTHTYPEEKLHEADDTYDVLTINMLSRTRQNIIYAVLCTVDVSEYRDEMYEISGGEKLPEYFAADIIDYYGMADFRPRAYRTDSPTEYEDFIVSENELEEWITELGVVKGDNPQMHEWNHFDSAITQMAM